MNVVIFHLFFYFTCLQLVELKEAEQMSLKESERLEKEIEEVREMKVNQKPFSCFCYNECMHMVCSH